MFLRSLYRHLFGWKVISGPFAGLRYVPNSVGSVHFAKLLGTYECELWTHVEKLISLAPTRIINIGAGEGYYAAGLAWRLPNPRVTAFETEAHGRELIGQIATLNAVGARVAIRGACTSSDLATALQGVAHPAIVIDAEGELLDPANVPALTRAVILVEVHDFHAPIGELLLPRFRSTHHVEEVQSRPRTARDLPSPIRAIRFTPWSGRAVNVMDEKRPGPMRWFWLEPRSP
ncbi:MAG: hypothetical protein Q8J74_01890 [Candidatus Didemnitutus sp.]|nr:hypothetical protein [Candidatus Didemnitutus sp.]